VAILIFFVTKTVLLEKTNLAPLTALHRLLLCRPVTELPQANLALIKSAEGIGAADLANHII
jgi:hypothetical protein